MDGEDNKQLAETGSQKVYEEIAEGKQKRSIVQTFSKLAGFCPLGKSLKIGSRK